MERTVKEAGKRGRATPGLAGLEGCREWLAWDFVERQPELEVGMEREEAVARLVPHYAAAVGRLGADYANLRTAEQVHGDGIAVVGEEGVGGSGILPHTYAGVDGLATDRTGVLLGILVADCCAVYVVDVVRRVVALLHSGKKGSELGIVPKAIGLMGERFGSRPGDMLAVLSPCIRPPRYEVDFAAAIRRQCAEAGLREEAIHDAGLCTGSDLRRFYSYRMERGKTGRMLALLGVRGPGMERE